MAEPPPQTEGAPPAPTLERGQAVDRFVVLGLLGRGGMGEVYAAYDPDLDRKVAIKLLRARGVSSGGRTRLLREAQAIAKLQHPNVVVVYDVGTFDEHVFIAMEFIEGRTVTGWLQAAPRTAREILQVYLAAGRGLVAAHAAGLVHRDFKPDNVMVTSDGQVRVMDFGLARSIKDGPDELDDPGLGELREPGDRTTSGRYLSVKLTQTGAMLGTPAYMAPEQFAVAPTDARTDQFSFCVALYEALHGERPFEGETFVTLMTNVTTGDVREPPAKTRVPSWLRKVLLRGLATKPDARYPSMAELLEALATDPTRRARRIGVGAGVALCLLAAALGARRATVSQRAICRGGAERLAGIWEPDGAASARKDAVHKAFLATGKSYARQAYARVARLFDDYAARWAGMYGEACAATHLRGEQSSEVLDLRMSCLQDRLQGLKALGDLFSRADAKVVENAVAAAGSLPRLDRCGDVPLLKAVIRPPDDEETQRRVQALRGARARFVALRDAGHCAEANKMADALIASVRRVGYAPLLAETLGEAAQLADGCGDSEPAVARAREAFTVAQSARHDEAGAKAAALLSTLLSNRFRRPEEARTWMDIGRATVERMGGHRLLEAWLLVSEGTILTAEGKGREAVAVLERSRVEKEKILGPDHHEVFIAVNNIGVGLQGAGRYEEARARYEEARLGFARVLGPDHPMVAMALNNEGESLSQLGRHGEARACFERAVAIWRKAETDPFLLSYGLTGLGAELVAEGRAGEAVAPLEEALRTRTAQQFDPEEVGKTRAALARAMALRPQRRP